MFHFQIIFETSIERVTGRLHNLNNGQIIGFVIRVSTWCFLTGGKKRDEQLFQQYWSRTHNEIRYSSAERASTVHPSGRHVSQLVEEKWLLES